MAKTRFIVPLLASAFLLAAPALAVDGVALIDHANALAGNVTPGDAPGYPATISLPGSYRLSGNLNPTADVNGIDVITPDVTIDLNGFRMDGSGLAAIGINGTQRYLTVRNGTIMKFAQDGINAYGAALIVEDMRISENSYGVSVGGDPARFARIVNSTIALNLQVGIWCNQSCHIEGNYIAGNQRGVEIKSGTLLGNTIQANNTGIVTGGGVGTGVVGYGNNSILGNGISRSGDFISLHTNVCVPAC
jgi:hypothetical protein